jgi:hypothetical protein
MVFTKTGVVNSDKSVLYVEKIIEEFFDIYSFNYKNERVVVTGKKENGAVHAKINVEGVGVIPVCIKKGKPGLLLSEKLAKQQTSIPESKIITESTIQKKQQQPVILVEKQKQEIINHVDNELLKYKDRLDFFTENATQFVETKVKEHGASLLKEYLKTVDQLRPTFESIITENFRNHIQNIDNYLKNKTSGFGNQILEYSNSNEQFKSEIFNKFEEVKTRYEKLITESVKLFDSRIEESNSSYEELKTKLTDYIVAAKEGAEELTNSALKNLQEKVEANLEIVKKESSTLALTESRNAIKQIEVQVEGIKTEIASIHEKNKKDLDVINEKNFEVSLLEIKNILNEENKKLVGLYNEQINGFTDVVKECKNEFKKMMSSLKEDITKSVLNSVNRELLEEKKDNKSNMMMNEIRSIKARLDAQYIQLRREIADVGGGGGNVAVQYADGGEMKGTLNVTNGGDYLSAGVNLADMYLRIDQIQDITNEQAQNFMQTLSNADLNLDTRGSMLSVLCASASEWIINHNFGYLPNVVIIDDEGDEIDGKIVHNATYTSLTATFTWNSAPLQVTGVAYLD